MVKYCSECGNGIESGYKFCPECGKKLMVRPTSCPDCGSKLKEKFKFCSECGREISPSIEKAMIKPKKVEKTETSKMVEETKPVEKQKHIAKVKPKVAKPKISLSFFSKFKRPGKKVLMLVSIICIALVVAAASLITLNPYNMANTVSFNEGSFLITVENTYDETVDYFLLIDDYYGIGKLDNPYELIIDDSIAITINEKDLTVQKNSHKITLYVYNEVSWISEEVLGVTESATFVISDDNGILNINCTMLQ